MLVLSGVSSPALELSTHSHPCRGKNGVTNSRSNSAVKSKDWGPPICPWHLAQLCTGGSKRQLQKYIRNRASWSPSKETSASPSKGHSSPAARHHLTVQSGQQDESWEFNLWSLEAPICVLVVNKSIPRSSRVCPYKLTRRKTLKNILACHTSQLGCPVEKEVGEICRLLSVASPA